MDTREYFEGLEGGRWIEVKSSTSLSVSLRVSVA